jgi:hypothetical protein
MRPGNDKQNVGNMRERPHSPKPALPQKKLSDVQHAECIISHSGCNESEIRIIPKQPSVQAEDTINIGPKLTASYVMLAHKPELPQGQALPRV